MRCLPASPDRHGQSFQLSRPSTTILRLPSPKELAGTQTRNDQLIECLTRLDSLPAPYEWYPPHLSCRKQTDMCTARYIDSESTKKPHHTSTANQSKCLRGLPPSGRCALWCDPTAHVRASKTSDDSHTGWSNEDSAPELCVRRPCCYRCFRCSANSCSKHFHDSSNLEEYLKITDV